MKTGGKITGKDLRDIRSFIESIRGPGNHFDLVMMGYTPGDDPAKAAKAIRPYKSAGLNWWLESLFRLKHSCDEMALRIRQGPPNLQ